MDGQIQTSKKKQKKKDTENSWKAGRRRAAIVSACAALGILLLVICGLYYWQKGEARSALRHGKDIYLAASVAAVEYYGEGKTFLSDSRESGVVKGAENMIRDLSEADGDFIIFAWDADKEKDRIMVYTEGNYLVYLSYENSEEMEWNVYRLDHLLRHDRQGYGE